MADYFVHQQQWHDSVFDEAARTSAEGGRFRRSIGTTGELYLCCLLYCMLVLNAEDHAVGHVNFRYDEDGGELRVDANDFIAPRTASSLLRFPAHQ